MENILKFLSKVVPPVLMILVAIVQATKDSGNSEDSEQV